MQQTPAKALQGLLVADMGYTLDWLLSNLLFNWNVYFIFNIIPESFVHPYLDSNKTNVACQFIITPPSNSVR